MAERAQVISLDRDSIQAIRKLTRAIEDQNNLKREIHVNEMTAQAHKWIREKADGPHDLPDLVDRAKAMFPGARIHVVIPVPKVDTDALDEKLKQESGYDLDSEMMAGEEVIVDKHTAASHSGLAQTPRATPNP